jgi:hypothetical protein
MSGKNERRRGRDADFASAIAPREREAAVLNRHGLYEIDMRIEVVRTRNQA